MRITVDKDTKSPFTLVWTIMKGTAICRKFPNKIRPTRRGYHLIWQDIDVDERTMFEYRYRIGDDLKRIHLDMSCPKKPKQVLFSEKKIYNYEYDSFGNLERKVEDRKHL